MDYIIVALISALVGFVAGSIFIWKHKDNTVAKLKAAGEALK